MISQYKRSSPGRKKHSRSFTSTTDSERKFYQSTDWRKYRARQLEAQLIHDRKVAFALLESGQVRVTEYAAWIATEKPLCQASLKAGLLVAANVLDHIVPIKKGGSTWDSNNLQWLSDAEHNRKSAKDKQ